MKNIDHKRLAYLLTFVMVLNAFILIGVHNSEPNPHEGYDTYTGVFNGTWGAGDNLRLWKFTDGTNFTFQESGQTPYNDKVANESMPITMGCTVTIWYKNDVLWDAEVLERED